MRSYLLYALFPFLFACAGDSEPPVAAATAPADERGLEQPDITVSIEGAAPGTVILVGQFMDQQFKADTAVADDRGTVHFQRAEPYEPGYYFAFFMDQTRADFLIDQDQTFTLTSKKSDMVGQMEVEGSTDNELLYESLQYDQEISPLLSSTDAMLQVVKPGQPDYQDLQSQRQQLLDSRADFYETSFAEHPESFYTSFRRAALLLQSPPNPDARQLSELRRGYWAGVDFDDDRLLNTPAIAGNLDRYISELTPQNADSINAAADELLQQVLDNKEYYRFFANAITLKYQPGRSEIMDPEAVYVHMIQQYFTRERAFWADSMMIYGLQNQADMMSHSLVGQAASNLIVPGLDGMSKRLFAEKAPYVIVFIYNPECDHCIEETPKLMEWSRKNKDRAAVYALALDTEDAKWKAFVEEFGLEDWTNVYDPSNQAIFKTYFVDTTPEMYLLDPDRKIIGKNLKSEELNAVIAAATPLQ